MNNTTTFPPPTCLPESDIIKNVENWTVCFFDLESNDLSDHCEIAQVSAVDFDGSRLFNQYVYLNGSISFWVTKVTGIIVQSQQESCFCHGKLVDAVEVNIGLNKFGLWLKDLCGRIVLVGSHNVRPFGVNHFCFALALKVLLIHSHYLEIFCQKNTPTCKKTYMRKLFI